MKDNERTNDKKLFVGCELGEILVVASLVVGAKGQESEMPKIGQATYRSQNASTKC